MIEWKDTTSYSQNKPKIPTCWTTNLGRYIKITVLREHLYYPGDWVMHFDPYYTAHPIGKVADTDEAAAKEIALRLAADKLRDVVRDAAPILEKF